MNGSEKLTAEDNVTGVSHLHHAMWRSVNLTLNETLIAADPINGYPLKSYIENRFTYSDASRQTLDDLLFAHPDTPD